MDDRLGDMLRVAASAFHALTEFHRVIVGPVKRSTPNTSTPLKAKRTSLKTRRFLCGLDAPSIHNNPAKPTSPVCPDTPQ